MKKVKLFWVGESKSGNHYLGIQNEEQGFIIRKFIQVTAEKAAEFEGKEDTEISVPASALA